MTCERAAQVHAYHDGECSPEVRVAIESHLADCEECTALLGDLRRMSQVVARAPLAAMPVGLPDRVERRAWARAGDRTVLRIASWLTAAAAAVLIAALPFWRNRS